MPGYALFVASIEEAGNDVYRPHRSAAEMEFFISQSIGLSGLAGLRSIVPTIRVIGLPQEELIV